MFIIDCISPISQKILETRLRKYVTEKNYQYIITDKSLHGLNIIQIGKDINFPFSEKQIEKYLIEPKKMEGLSKKLDKTIREEIISIIKINNNKILKDIEELLEKR